MADRYILVKVPEGAEFGGALDTHDIWLSYVDCTAAVEAIHEQLLNSVVAPRFRMAVLDLERDDG